jgi:phosphate transport system substrate-binding protein
VEAKKMGYLFQALLIAFIVFPFLTFFVVASFVWSRYAFIAISLPISLFLGWLLSRKCELPDSFSSRYWPLLSPIVLILGYRIIDNIGEKFLSYRGVEVTVFLALCYVPLIASFAVFCIASKKKIASSKWRLQTYCFISALFATLVWQTKPYFGNTLELGERNDVAIHIEELDLQVFSPWFGDNKLARLNAPSSLRLNGNYPVIDGATAFFPIYAAVVNEVYQADDKKELEKYIRCSRTAQAYSELISGSVDLIVALQPSDEQLERAKKAGVELHLTSIAKEAFVFFVNGQNSVSDLSIEQIQDIYLKKITNWRQVGGNDTKIIPFQRPDNSGSQTTMVKEVMRDKALPLPLIEEFFETMYKVVRDVARYRDYEEAIGYSFRFFTREMMRYTSSHRARFTLADDAAPVKLLSVNGVAPTEENIRNGRYPLTVDIFAITADTSNPNVRKLIDWLISPQGQELIEKVGYVGI